METIIVDKNLYSLKSILSTAYVFLDKFYIFLDKIDEDKISIQIKAKSGEREGKDMVDNFKNELINASLRLKISEDNKNIREAIVSAAFYGVGIQAEEVRGRKGGSCRGRESLNDPQGIRKTWEELHKDEAGQITHTSCKTEILDSKSGNEHEVINKISPQRNNTDYSKMSSKDGDKNQ